MIEDTTLYVLGSYVMGSALALVELLLLRLRDKSIRAHLGWPRLHRSSVAPPEADADPSGRATTS